MRTVPPLISVVMGVYNGAKTLPETLESVLNQSDVDQEFIIVNDGSTDKSPEILQEYALNDERIKIIDQQNLGLTPSLIRGCAEAKGEYIARQDDGDVSLQNRLVKQIGKFQQDSSVVLVSGGTRFLGPGGEVLYSVQQDCKEADANLRSADAAVLRGPSHHGCTMFRRDAYIKSGGYRAEFEVAQDLDLWTRLVEIGKHAIVPEVLYQASLLPGAISSSKRVFQQKTTDVIVECMKARQATGDDSKQIRQLADIYKNNKPVNQNKVDADFYYFISRVLKNNDAKAAQQYIEMALRLNPLQARFWVRMLQGKMGF